MNHPSAKNIALWIVCAFAFLVLAKCSTASGAMTADERAIVAQARSRITELQESLDKQTSLTSDAMGAQTLALAQITALTEDARKAADAAAALTAERDGLKDKVAEKDAVISAQKADKAKLLASFHTFKLITASAVAGLAALLVGLLVFRFLSPALNTVPGCALAFGAPAAIGGLVFTLVITR